MQSRKTTTTYGDSHHYNWSKENVYLIVKFNSFCIVCVCFSLKCCTGDRLGPNLATKNPPNNIIILQRSVQPGKQIT